MSGLYSPMVLPSGRVFPPWIHVALTVKFLEYSADHKKFLTILALLLTRVYRRDWCTRDLAVANTQRRAVTYLCSRCRRGESVRDALVLFSSFLCGCRWGSHTI